MNFPFVTTDQAAKILNVSASRVRQLISEKKLTPLPIPGRNTLFSRGAVEQLALRYMLGATRITDGISVSPALSEIPTPEQPRPLLYDSIVRQPHTAGSVAHIRIWGGDDGFFIVLAGTPRGSASGTITNRIEDTARLIVSIMPRIDLAKTAFVELLSHPGGVAAYELMTVSIGIEHSLVTPFRHEHGYEVFFDDLERALGQTPTLWHRSEYTTENIVRYQRTQRPLLLLHDPLNVGHRDECLIALEESDDPTTELILDLLAPGCELMTMRNHNLQHLQSPAYELDGHTYPWPPQATSLVQMYVPEIVQKVAIERKNRVSNRFAQLDREYRSRVDAALEHGEHLHEEEFETGEIEAMRRELIAFAESLQPKNSKNQALLLSATEDAINALSWTTIGNHVAHEVLAERLPYPDQHTVAWICPSGDPATAKYLEHTRLLPAHEHPDLTDDERDALTDAAIISNGATVLFGRDPQGYAVMQVTDRDGYRTHYCLTRRSTNIRLDRTDTLLSAAISTGHVPLFIQRGTEIIGTIPLTQRTSMLNFGYGGGGPGAAAAAITRMLTLSGHTVNADTSRAIERFTEDSRWEEATNAYTSVGALLDGTYPEQR